jgi:hypothetical protein
MIYSFVVLLVFLATIHAYDYLPERARGGELYQHFLNKYGKKVLDASEPLWWDAPVDHFSNATNTFRQR